MFRSIVPAPLVETLELYTKNGRAKPMAWRSALLQMAKSESIGFCDGDTLIGAAMLWPCPAERDHEDLRELVFVCRPEARRHLIGIIHAARLTRARFGDDVRIRARVRAGHVPGQRLALLCGLRLVATIVGFELYECEGQMTQFAEGVKSLFGNGNKDLERQQAQARETQGIQLDKQKEQEQSQEQELDATRGAAGRTPRGRRLLLAATGEQGLQDTIA